MQCEKRRTARSRLPIEKTTRLNEPASITSATFHRTLDGARLPRLSDHQPPDSPSLELLSTPASLHYLVDLLPTILENEPGHCFLESSSPLVQPMSYGMSACAMVV